MQREARVVRHLDGAGRAPVTSSQCKLARFFPGKWIQKTDALFPCVREPHSHDAWNYSPLKTEAYFEWAISWNETSEESAVSTSPVTALIMT